MTPDWINDVQYTQSGLFSYILEMPPALFKLGKMCRKSQRLGI